MDHIELLQAFHRETEAADKIRTEAAHKLFKAIFDELFAAYPVVHGIRWMQYTDYFNDGEPCVFRARVTHDYAEVDFYLDPSEVPEGSTAAEDAEHDGPDVIVNSEDLLLDSPLIFFLKNRLEQIPAPVFLAAFGDHAKVVARPGGIFEVEAYDDHD